MLLYCGGRTCRPLAKKLQIRKLDEGGRMLFIMRVYYIYIGAFANEAAIFARAFWSKIMWYDKDDSIFAHSEP